tara:strand:- start:3562 stop:3783 length:222 start_codon:yes stop_codon:yes gene_type:complete
MVRINDINIMVEDNLDDFYKDGSRFKGMKLLIDFKPINSSVESPDIKFNKPKFKKAQKISKFIKNNNNKKSLF